MYISKCLCSDMFCNGTNKTTRYTTVKYTSTFIYAPYFSSSTSFITRIDKTRTIMLKIYIYLIQRYSLVPVLITMPSLKLLRYNLLIHPVLRPKIVSVLYHLHLYFLSTNTFSTLSINHNTSSKP